MKKIVIAACSIFLIFYVLSKSGVLSALLIFLLAGVVPGTNWSLPAGVMLGICAAIAFVFTTHFVVFSIVQELDLRRLTRKYIARKNRMPKKRFLSVSR